MRWRALLAGLFALALMALSPAQQSLLLGGASLIPSLDLNFLTQGVDPRITFTRASNATSYDSTGTLQTASTNTPRIDYDPTTLAIRGLLIEEARTNAMRNPRAEGSSAGVPGTPPTNWSVQAVSITSPVSGIVGSGTESGIQYVDISLAGTLPAGGTAYFVYFEPAGIIAALTGQVWSMGLNYRLMSGALPTGSVQLQESELTSGGGAVTTQTVTVASPTGAALATQRPTGVLTLSGGATTAFLRPNLKFSFGGSLGTTFTFVIRIGGVQSELGAFATSLILPAVASPAATTRAADVATMPVGPWFNPNQGALAADVQLLAETGSTAPRIMSFSDGTTANLLELLISLPNVSYQQVVATVSGTSNFGTFTTAQMKAAAAYRSGAQSGVLNGGAVNSTALAGVPGGLTILGLGNRFDGARPMSGYLRRVRYWSRALGTGELQQVTMP